MSMPYGDNHGEGSGSGYSYDPQALSSIAGGLRDGADALDKAVGKELRPVDAGASSDAVGKALSDLMRMAIGVAGSVGGAANGVHEANGAYGEIENNNAGRMKFDEADEDSPSRTVHG